MKKRFRSALLGVALGDAWGYPYQVAPQPSSTPLPSDLVISDDTQMTLALSTAMRAIDSTNAARHDGMMLIAQQLVDYRMDEDYDRYPGPSSSEALERLADIGVERWKFAGTHSGGSGAVMRTSASALLAPTDQGVGWSVLQGVLTHDSALSRASCAIAACALAAREGSDLIEVASGLAGDRAFNADTLLSDKEKNDLLRDFSEARIQNIGGCPVTLSELIDRVSEVREFLSTPLDDGDFEVLYRKAGKIVKILGRGWDAGSCVASALLLTQLYLDHSDSYAPHDLLHVAVNWPGNRNTRGSLTGALLGAHLSGGPSDWEAARNYQFEPRYNEAIHTGAFPGFRNA